MSENIPFVDAHNHDELVIKSGDSTYADISKKLNLDGYCVVDLGLSDLLIDKANQDVEQEIINRSYKKNADAFHYNDSPRIVEGWRFSKSIKEIVVNKKLLDIVNI